MDSLRGKELCLSERETIFAGCGPGDAFSLIGARLGRHGSVISREVERNGGRAAYRPSAAQDRADAQRARPKQRRLLAVPRLHAAVAAGLAEDYSPAQVSARLKVDFPDDADMRVSHETIYECLYLQARGELRTELKLALRTGRAKRVPRDCTRVKTARIAGMVNISERPAEAADRAVPGHWEGDLIVGAGGRSQIATLVERTTRFTMLVRIPYDKTAERVALCLSRAMGRLPEALGRTLTWDQGTELAAHAKFTVATNIPVYFCDPHSPWQRGSNENTNGLLRQYYPKGTDLSGHTQRELDIVAAKLNNRPRKTLGWNTPTEKLQEFLKVPG
ncbi:MAG: IS30 family transposase [Nitrospiraceae bacterium]